MIWFTVQLDDKPGALARMAAALGDRGINITAIVGVAEDTDGALMLTTSDADRDAQGFRCARARLRRARSPGGHEPGRDDRATGLAGRGMSSGG